MNRKSELIDVSVLLLVEKEKAILVTEELKDKNGKQINHWLPVSQIEWSKLHDRGVICVTMPRWLFEEKGFTPDD